MQKGGYRLPPQWPNLGHHVVEFDKFWYTSMHVSQIPEEQKKKNSKNLKNNNLNAIILKI